MKLNKKITAVNASPTLTVTMRANDLAAQGIKVIPLAAGQTDFDTPEFINEACIKALNEGQTKYTPSAGILQLRQAICQKFKQDNNLEYTEKQVIVSCGAKHSLYNIFQIMIDSDDEVIIPIPYWVSYPEMVTLAGGKSIFIEAKEENGLKITPQQLEAAITPKTKIFVFNSPSNPTGVGYSKQDIQKLAEVLKKYPDIAIVSDEIYEHLTYNNFKHFSFAEAASELFDRTFTVNGFTKAYSMPGWRLGYTGCPNETIAAAMNKLQEQSTTGTNSFAQFGGIAALLGDQSIVKEMRDEFDSRRKFIVDAFNKMPGVTCLDPQGAFYIFPNIKKWKMSSLDVAMSWLEDIYVAAVPGSAFGLEGYIRCSFATSMINIQEAANRINTWIKNNVKL